MEFMCSQIFKYVKFCRVFKFKKWKNEEEYLLKVLMLILLFVGNMCLFMILYFVQFIKILSIVLGIFEGGRIVYLINGFEFRQFRFKFQFLYL